MNLCITLLLAQLTVLHPLHISYSNIEINQEEESVQVSHKILTEDFILLFYHLFEKDVTPKNESEFTPSELALIENYMKYRFSVIADTDTVLLHYTGKQLQDDYIWLNYTGKIMNALPARITIKNQLLLDLNMDQRNLVIVNTGKHEEGISFTLDLQEKVLEMND